MPEEREALSVAARKLLSYLDVEGQLSPSANDPGWDLVADLRAALEACGTASVLPESWKGL